MESQMKESKQELKVVTEFDEGWLRPNAVVMVDSSTTGALLREIIRLRKMQERPCRHGMRFECSLCISGEMPPEVRLKDDGTLDEVVAHGFQLEQMNHDHWFLEIAVGDKAVAVWLTAKGKITATYEHRDTRSRRDSLIGRLERAVERHRELHCGPAGLVYYKHEDQLTEDLLLEAMAALRDGGYPTHPVKGHDKNQEQ
jgi:hypothetical protein